MSDPGGYGEDSQGESSPAQMIPKESSAPVDRGTDEAAKCAACERSSLDTLIFTCCAAHDARMCGDCYNRNHPQRGYSSGEFNAYHDGWAAANKASGALEIRAGIERLAAEWENWRNDGHIRNCAISLRAVLAETWTDPRSTSQGTAEGSPHESGTPEEGEAENGA